MQATRLVVATYDIKRHGQHLFSLNAILDRQIQVRPTIMIPEKPKLEIGRAYFLCGYYIRDLPIPQIETWIYVGSNIHDDDGEEDEIFHYFEDPGVYFEECVRDELIDLDIPRDAAEEADSEKLRVADSCLEAHVYDYEGLRKWINSLAMEPDADKAF